jgi:hypothetical protein
MFVEPNASESLPTGAVPLVQLPATLQLPLVGVELRVCVVWAWPSSAHADDTVVSTMQNGSDLRVVLISSHPLRHLNDETFHSVRRSYEARY